MSDLYRYCEGLSELKLLYLRDGCFRIEHKNNELTKWCCFENMAYPVDGYEKILTSVGSYSDYLLFDNQFDQDSPEPSYTNKLIVRGIMFFVFYDKKNDDGEPVEDYEKNLGLKFYDVSYNEYTVPLFETYATTWNPVSDDHSKIINKMEVVNDNNFGITISGMLLLGDRNGVTLDGAGPGC